MLTWKVWSDVFNFGKHVVHLGAKRAKPSPYVFIGFVCGARSLCRVLSQKRLYLARCLPLGRFIFYSDFIVGTFFAYQMF